MSKSYIVYLITNKINNKKYVGITSRTLSQRWNEHINQAKNNPIYTFHKAIKKYGTENFIQEIIEENLTQEQAKEREIYWIKYYNTFSGYDCGYNDTFGGDLNNHLKGENSPVAKITSDQCKQIIILLQNSNLSYKQIIEQLKLNISEGEISSINFGKTWYQDNLKYPIRNGRSVSKSGVNNHFAKLTDEIVLQIIDDLRNTKIMQKDLAKKYNVSCNTINFINRCRT